MVNFYITTNYSVKICINMSKRGEYSNDLSKFLTNKAVGADKLDPLPAKKIGKKGEKLNDLFASCYSLYLTGKSLRYIAQVHYKNRFTHQNLEGAFKARGYKLRSKELQPAIVYKGITYRKDKNGGYRNRKNGVLKYLHHLIWEEHNGPIPKNYYVLFKDGNKDNVVIENLQLMQREEAKKLYNYANQSGYKRFPGLGQWGRLVKV